MSQPRGPAQAFDPDAFDLGDDGPRHPGALTLPEDFTPPRRRAAPNEEDIRRLVKGVRAGREWEELVEALADVVEPKALERWRPEILRRAGYSGPVLADKAPAASSPSVPPRVAELQTRRRKAAEALVELQQRAADARAAQGEAEAAFKLASARAKVGRQTDPTRREAATKRRGEARRLLQKAIDGATDAAIAEEAAAALVAEVDAELAAAERQAGVEGQVRMRALGEWVKARRELILDSIATVMAWRKAVHGPGTPRALPIEALADAFGDVAVSPEGLAQRVRGIEGRVAATGTLGFDVVATTEGGRE